MKAELVAVSTNPWNGQWMNRQHLMWAMKDLTKVLYVEEPRPWYVSKKTRDEHYCSTQTMSPAPDLTVLRLPKMLCFRGAPGRWNDIVLARKSRRILRHCGENVPRVLYFWHPELCAYARYLRPRFVVYHVYDLIDQYYRSEFEGTPLRAAFDEAVRIADLVLTGTAEQAEIVKAHKVEIVPNGVPMEWYETKHDVPADIASISGPRIGYVGRVSSKIDWQWVEALAKIEAWQIVLVGPLHLNESDQRIFHELCRQPNVHYLGEKSAREIPHYMRSLDVGLLCYKRGTHMEGASPIKLFEYLAAGLPVVGSRLRTLVRDPAISRLVQLVDAPREAVAAVSHSLQTDGSEEARGERLVFARNNSWKRRATTIQTMINAGLEG